MAAQSARRPNVIVFISDDQGYADLSLHGNTHLKTPNLDRIGTEGAQFTQFQVCPVCSPTRSSLMTGRYNYRTGIVDTFLGRSMMDPREVTAAEVFAANSYRTGIFGKWHLGDNYPMRTIDQGFHESLVHGGGGLAQPADPPGGNHYYDPVLVRNGKQEKVPGYCTDIFFREAMAFIDRNKAKPFFLYLPTNAPHTPLEIDDRYVAPFKAAGLDDVTAKVYGMVKNLDDNTGALLANLDKSGLAQNTILIFMTDNGPQQPRYVAGMRGRKGTVYQGGIRVPFFFRWPARIKAGAEVGRIAAHIDVLPTLIDACALKPPECEVRRFEPVAFANGRAVVVAGSRDPHAMASRRCAGSVSGARGADAEMEASQRRRTLRHGERSQRDHRCRGEESGSCRAFAEVDRRMVSRCGVDTRRLRSAAHLHRHAA